jgi:hypothetical protein
MDDDVLVGLRFEVSGGLGRMSGRVVGKTGSLYLVQKDGVEHLELLEIDDLRSAKFYRVAQPNPVADEVKAHETPTTDQPTTEQPRRKLSDQIRKHLTSS